jgi:hypothetical protein
MTTFVQFPHLGGEHRPESDDMPWNTGAHGRKFLISDGRYVDANNGVRQGELVFWGEWEPPSRVEHWWPRDGRLPRVLHRPYWVRGIGQNTDPWVFGDRMRYSNCRQAIGAARRSTSMQTLSPVHGMYSFVPAKPPGDPQPPFARPLVRVAGLINPAGWQGTRGAKRPLEVAELRKAWNTIRDQVLAAGLVLATHLKTPVQSAPAPARLAVPENRLGVVTSSR